MYFYNLKGKQALDLRGDLVLTHNAALVIGRVKSAAPSAVRNAKYIADIPSMSVWRKLRASWAALRFIWGKSEALAVRECDQWAEK